MMRSPARQIAVFAIAAAIFAACATPAPAPAAAPVPAVEVQPAPAPASEPAPIAEAAPATEAAPVPAPAPAAEPATEPVEVSACELPQEPTPPPKVAKERSVIVKTPVLLRENAYYSDGLLDQYSVFKLDDAKRLVLERATYDASRPDPIERLAYEYKDGRLAAETLYEADGKIRTRREYLRDQAGRLLSEKTVDAKGIAQSSSSYAYDADGNKTEWRVFDGKGIPKAVTSYVNEGGLLARIVMQDAAGKPTGTIALDYGEAGLLAKRSYFAADGSLQKYEVFAYAPGAGAKAGPSSVENRRSDGSLASRLGFELGTLGEALKTTTYDASGSVRDFRKAEYLIREDSVVETYYE